MPTSFRRYQPDQSSLLPASPRDWLPENHLAYFVSDAVESLDLRAVDTLSISASGESRQMVDELRIGSGRRVELRMRNPPPSEEQPEVLVFMIPAE